jgi:hypothetical protein|tara:strand:+ start:553 stop:687 length:135 start_codon:yes stop_codon:yes gene_type:complete
MSSEKFTKKPTRDIEEELRKMLKETKQGSEWQERLTSKVRELVG